MHARVLLASAYRLDGFHGPRARTGVVCLFHDVPRASARLIENAPQVLAEHADHDHQDAHAG